MFVLKKKMFVIIYYLCHSDNTVTGDSAKLLAKNQKLFSIEFA